MNDPNSFGYTGQNPEMPAASPGPPNVAQYKFSPDEMRVLQDCNRESFYSRSLPLASILGLGTAVGIQSGYLRPNARFGAFPKVTLAVVVGYFLGKLSYQQACAQKLMALPGSYIGQLLRERRDGKAGGTPSLGSRQPAGSMLGARADDIYSDAGPGSSLDLDSERANRVFSEDLSRPDQTGPDGSLGPESGVPRPPMSYDELRRQNRGNHASSQQDPYRVETERAPIVRRAPPPRPSSPPTNAYGDVME